MYNFTHRLGLLIAFLQMVHGFYGPNVCTEEQIYTMTMRVKYQQPVSVKTYRWCLGIPPRCSATHIEMREKWKVQTVNRTKSIESCCKGFEEDEGRCVPKCPAGFMGDSCEEGCPLDKWGPSCTETCECPKNSICNVMNGSCICLDGWSGTSCDISMVHMTRMPISRSDKELLKNTHLFNWNQPTMADIQSTENLSTNRNAFIITTPTFILITYPTENSTTNNDNIPNRQQETTNIGNASNRQPQTTNVENTSNRQLYTINIANTLNRQSETTTMKIPITATSTTRTIMSESVPRTTKTEIKALDITTESAQFNRTNSSNVRSTETVSVINEMLNSSTTSSERVPTTVKIRSTSKPNTTLDSTVRSSQDNFKEQKLLNTTENNKEITLKSNNPLKSQIESPAIETSTVTTYLQNVNLTTTMTTKINSPTANTEKSTTTTKKKIIKHHKTESEILNITLHSFPSKRNETGSKIFKTITLPPVSNTTVKVPQQKGKVLHESKMITIPVRVIMESEKTPSNIYAKKTNSETSKTDQKLNRFVTSSPMYTLEVQTEETKHVLTEPEQITSIAGDDYDFETRDDFVSVFSISIGVMLIIILSASIIVLVTRCRQIRADKVRDMKIDHVQSMMNVSEDEMQSGYLRSVFHSPLPESQSQIITIKKPQFSVPFQSTLSRPVSPALLESFRDILECHYDHPKPPRPANISHTDESSYQVPPSMYQHLNTFRTSSISTNQYTNEDLSLPVTDAAISVLKLQHSQIPNMENKEPVYAEIPPWVVRIPQNLNISMYANDEAVTEL